MKLITSEVKIIPQESGLLGVYKQIEKAGRTCYKSEDKITDDSCKEFVQRMINYGHTAMLEHGTVYLQADMIYDNDHIIQLGTALDKYLFNKYSDYTFNASGAYVTTNLRVLQENGWLDDLKYLCTPTTAAHPRRVTVRFICDRGVSHELVRHKGLCVA